MKPENLQRAIELEKQLRDVEWAKTNHIGSSVWIMEKIRKRFILLLEEHKKELLDEVCKL